MSPLRDWMRTHHMPAWYSWVVVILMSVASVGMSMVISAKTTQRAIETERNARQQAGEAGRAATCALVVAQDNVFRENVPATETGREVAQAWRDMRNLLHCDGK